MCPIGVSHSQWNAGDGPMRVYYEHRPALTSAEIFFETQFGLSRDGKLSSTGEINLLQGAVLLAEVGDFIRPASPARGAEHGVPCAGGDWPDAWVPGSVSAICAADRMRSAQTI